MNRVDDHDPDADLLARIGRGEQQAARAIVDRKLPRLIALATRMLGDAGEAEDVAQETFVRLWRQASRWRRGEAKVDTWLHRVALNQCYDRLRRRRPQPQPDPGDGPAHAPPPDRPLDARETTLHVAEALQSLPDRQREAIILHYYQELSNVEAATVMEISVEALESLLARARRALRARLQDMIDDA